MHVEAHVTINASKEAIWQAICDIENAPAMMSSIEEVEILDRPAHGIIGLKWRETRVLFGKKATEVMWITDAAENEFYDTRAESHGFIYVCSLRISASGGNCVLTMTHDSSPQTFLARCMLVPMWIFKGAIKKAFSKDLHDIKAAVEKRTGTTPEETVPDETVPDETVPE